MDWDYVVYRFIKKMKKVPPIPIKPSQLKSEPIKVPYQLTRQRIKKDKLMLKITLRKYFMHSKLNYYILRKAARHVKEIATTRYLCAQCNTLYALEHVEVDHIEEVAQNFLEETKTLHEYAHQLVFQFFDENNLQVLCKQCHRKKTAQIHDL